MLLPEPWDSAMNYYKLYMLHDEKAMTGGHDVYDVPSIFKAVVDHFQMIDLESRALYIWTIF